MKLTTTTEHIQSDFQDGILLLRFNRPEKKNALNLAMYTALADALRCADEEEEARVVLLTGGEACFTSGNDLSDFLTSPPGGKDSPAMRFLEALSRARKPVIAAVNGMAIGIGVTMLLHCDLVYAGASACFQMPFVNLGLCPEGGSSFLLPRMMGHQRAAELLLLGECFDASTAREAGIVNSVCPDHELRALARAGAEKLAARPPSAMRLAKNLLKRGYAVSLQETMAEEGALFGQLLKSPEAVEAMRAFLERRKPDGNRFAGKTG